MSDHETPDAASAIEVHHLPVDEFPPLRETPDAGEGLDEVEVEAVRRCPDCRHDWSGHVDLPLPFMTCSGKRGLGSISGCRCTATLPVVVERIVAARVQTAEAERDRWEEAADAWEARAQAAETALAEQTAAVEAALEATEWNGWGGKGRLIERIRAALANPTALDAVRAEVGALHPEDYCHRCDGPNISWFTPGAVWDPVMRPDGDGTWKWEEIICPLCFVELAGGGTWHLIPSKGDGERWTGADERAEVGARALREAAEDYWQRGDVVDRFTPWSWLRARADALTPDTAGGVE